MFDPRHEPLRGPTAGRARRLVNLNIDSGFSRPPAVTLPATFSPPYDSLSLRIEGRGARVARVLTALLMVGAASARC
jgi:hypothetical protein